MLRDALFSRLVSFLGAEEGNFDGMKEDEKIFFPCEFWQIEKMIEIGIAW